MAREIKIALVRSIAFGLLLELMLVGAILYFPNFRENIPALRALAPLPMLRNLVDELEEGGAMAYVVGQHFFKGCNTLGTAAAVLMAVGAVAGEVQRGTLEIWLSRPVTRTRLLLERWACGAAGLLLPVFLTSASIPALMRLPGIDEELALGPLLLCSAHQGLLLLALYSLTFLLSSLGRSPTGIAFAMLFGTTFQFAIYLVERLTRGSIYRLSDIDDFARIFDRGRLDPAVCLPLAAFSLAALGLSLAAFRRRHP